MSAADVIPVEIRTTLFSANPPRADQCIYLLERAYGALERATAIAAKNPSTVGRVLDPTDWGPLTDWLGGQSGQPGTQTRINAMGKLAKDADDLRADVKADPNYQIPGDDWEHEYRPAIADAFSQLDSVEDGSAYLKNLDTRLWNDIKQNARDLYNAAADATKYTALSLGVIVVIAIVLFLVFESKE